MPTKLLMVGVIIAFLTTEAYSGYQEYLERANRNEARAALLQIAIMQDRFYLQNDNYTADMTKLGFPSVGSNRSGSESYIIKVDFADALDFTATATYQFADAEAGQCARFQIDSRGRKSSAPVADCWTQFR